MQLDHAWIARHIPHQGAMCLLSSVLNWNEEGARCHATSHLDLDNPLRMEHGLAAICGVEYAAQAVAVHGVLLAGDRGLPPPSGGYLASLRHVSLYAERLDECPQPLLIEALRFGGDQYMLLYDFVVRAGGRCLLEGRLSVVVQA